MTRHLLLTTVRALLYSAIFGLPPSGAIAQGNVPDGEYKSPNGMFSVRVPKPSSWASVPYAVTNLDATGSPDHDEVMFHAGDFGIYLVAGAGRVPAESAALMDRDDVRVVLGNLSQATLMKWRADLTVLPPVVQESFVESAHGQAIVRVYRAEKGSFLARAQGRRPTREDAFDTNIASMVARRGSVIVYALAQNDSSPDDAAAAARMASDLFGHIALMPAQATAAPPQTGAAHVEDCAVWGYRHDNDHFGAVNNCKDAIRIQFMLTNNQRVIETEVKPGDFFDTGHTSKQVESTRWLFTACPIGYVPGVPFSLEHEDELRASRYSCLKKQ